MKEASALDKEPTEAKGLSFPSGLPQHGSQRDARSQCLRNTPTHPRPQLHRNVAQRTQPPPEQALSQLSGSPDQVVSRWAATNSPWPL